MSILGVLNYPGALGPCVAMFGVAVELDVSDQLPPPRPQQEQKLGTAEQQ